MKTIRILCLNCFGIPISANKTLRFNLIAKAIEKIKPDLVMLQEVIFHKDKLILQNELENKGWKFYSDKNWLMEKGGLVVLSRHFDLENAKFKKFTHQGPKDLISIPDKILGKGFQSFTLHFENHEFLLINTHFVCPYAAKEKDIISQRKQFTQLTRFINSQKADGIILCGDINTFPDSPEMTNLKNDCGLSDSLDVNSYTVDPKNLNRGWLMNIFGDGNKYRSDYTLFSPNIKIKESKVVFEEAKFVSGKETHISDHFGILTSVEI